jgi:hypothetical protein
LDFDIFHDRYISVSTDGTENARGKKKALITVGEQGVINAGEE